MKIRAQMKGDVADIRVLMSHAMETGQRKVLQGQTGPAVSRNPVFGFKVKGAKAGDKVVINWVDNKGDKRTDEATIG
ncbi:MAG: thiosulfate oxidation carrier complex protein SoxZ [Rhodocyclaceae bacterium]|nr:thiosulfate oxidation carrier complex protein SoxZ [Rhodocyclaceae bacterium]